MKQLSGLFVPYLIAKQLKELGFNEPCIGIHRSYIDFDIKHTSQGLMYLQNSDLSNSHCSAPVYQQAVSFLFEKLNNITHIQHKVKLITYQDGSGCWMLDELNNNINFTNPEMMITEALKLITP